MNLLFRSLLAFIFLLLIGLNARSQGQWQSKLLAMQKNGELKYIPDRMGNRLPDFSGVGYKQNKAPLPNVRVVKVIAPVSDDAQQVIQAAIDQVAQLPIDKNGF